MSALVGKVQRGTRVANLLDPLSCGVCMERCESVTMSALVSTIQRGTRVANLVDPLWGIYDVGDFS